MRVAPTWTDTGDYTHTETLLLELTAPSSYLFGPTIVQFHSDTGRISDKDSSHSIAAHYAASITEYLDSPEARASSVSDCAIGGDGAAALGYSKPNEVGYRVYVLHKSYLFEVRLAGAGGPSDQSVADVKKMIDSITWGTWNNPGEAT